MLCVLCVFFVTLGFCLVWRGEKDWGKCFREWSRESWDVKSVKIEGEMKSAVRVLAGEENLGIAVNRLQGGCVKG
ncbi:hypothetical protein [Bartonella sp. AS69XJJH]|uniref:hypothetical protein n=1 Tax=Bartonella sp. AS69XJJH TaxID=3243508 RepID=UPI0035CF244A